MMKFTQSRTVKYRVGAFSFFCELAPQTLLALYESHLFPAAGVRTLRALTLRTHGHAKKLVNIAGAVRTLTHVGLEFSARISRIAGIPSAPALGGLPWRAPISPTTTPARVPIAGMPLAPALC